jgi:hypothetical protein
MSRLTTLATTKGRLADADAWCADQSHMPLAGPRSTIIERLWRSVFPIPVHAARIQSKAVASCPQTSAHTCLGHNMRYVACCNSCHAPPTEGLLLCPCIGNGAPTPPPHRPPTSGTCTPRADRPVSPGALTTMSERSGRSTAWAASRSACCRPATCRRAGHARQEEGCMPCTTRPLVMPRPCPPSSAPPRLLYTFVEPSLCRRRRVWWCLLRAHACIVLCMSRRKPAPNVYREPPGGGG